MKNDSFYKLPKVLFSDDLYNSGSIKIVQSKDAMQT